MSNFFMVLNMLASGIIIWRASEIAAHMTYRTNYIVRLVYIVLAVASFVQFLDSFSSFVNASWPQVAINLAIAAMLVMDRRQKCRIKRNPLRKVIT